MRTATVPITLLQERARQLGDDRYVERFKACALPGTPTDQAVTVEVDCACIRELRIRYSPSRGLGDTVAKVIHATGLHHLAKLKEKVTGKPCKCPERQEALNRLMPYRPAGAPAECPERDCRRKQRVQG